MKKLLLLSLSFMAVCTAFAGGKKEAAPIAQMPTAPVEQTPTAYFEGDGGNGKTISILPLNGNGVPAEQNDLLGAIQLEFMDNFSSYSNIAVSNRKNQEEIYRELYSGYYDDDSKELDLGHLTPPDYFMNGSITKTASAYALQVQITTALDKTTVASYSGTWTFDELDNFTGVRHASSELLEKLGVRLTEAGKQKLTGAADANTVNAQTTLARANTAPTAFERMQYTYEAAAIDPSLQEAARRLSVYQAAMLEIPAFTAPSFSAPTFTLPAIQPVSTGNIGADARDELARYRANKAAIEEQQQTLLQQRETLLEQWQDFLIQLEDQRQPLHDQERRLFQRQEELVAMLRDAEAFYTEHPPFRIFYNPATERYGSLNYENATVDLRFRIAAEPTSVDALNAVLDALVNLNNSFTTVNNAYKEVNTVMSTRFNQVQNAMATVKNALTEANNTGQQYAVPAAGTETDWTVPPGTNVYGAELTSDWYVDYPQTFSITASLLNDTGAVIGRGAASASITAEAALAWCNFENVQIDDITDTLTVRIDTVNNRDVANAAMMGYIAIVADEAYFIAMDQRIAERKAAQVKALVDQIATKAVQEAAREYWAPHLTGLGLAIGIESILYPSLLTFLVSARFMVSPFSKTFLEAGLDLATGEDYLSTAPYLHFNLLLENDSYIGIGGGPVFLRYASWSGSHVEQLSWVLDVHYGGLFWMSSHSGIQSRLTAKIGTNTFYELQASLGYIYRFGY